jgi:XTP/dITP diphosphohydrolase
MPTILLATGNAGKLRELRAIVAGTPLACRGLADYPGVAEAEETGATFAANARQKALHYAAATGSYTLADDSGLEVDALDGAPGVHSARYAGEPRSDEANNRRLLEALADVSAARRTARFRCAMALAHDGAVLLESEGAVEGRILEVPRGHNGFGYDPLFLIPDLDLTAAELPSERKHALSHRGQALRVMLARMETLFRAQGCWTT